MDCYRSRCILNPDGVHDYNPTQAGANPYWPSTVMGAACNGSGSMNVFSSMLNYYNLPGSTAPVVSVFGGQLVYDAYMTPYVIRTYADWVQNPGGSPAYYLRLTEYVINVGGENYGWSFDLAAYFATNLPAAAGSPSCTTAQSPCTTQEQLPLLGGSYIDASLNNGIAVGVGRGSPLSTVFNAYWFQGRGSTDVHLFFANVPVEAGQPRVFTWYVMPGTFAAAQNFMANHS